MSAGIHRIVIDKAGCMVDGLEGAEMVHFVGAGAGAPDLITVRGLSLLREADVVIYAGSLVNPVLLGYCREGVCIYDSKEMTLPQVLAVMRDAEAEGLTTVRLHTGDPAIYGAIREQMDALREAGISFDVTPGVSSFCAAAAALKTEYTLPEVSQTVIITRLEGRTPVPEKEKLERLAGIGATMVIFLSAGATDRVREALLKGAYTEDTPAAIVYKASWPEERLVRCTVGTLHEAAVENDITRFALILVGDFLREGPAGYEKSRLYAPEFTTGFRRGSDEVQL